MESAATVGAPPGVYSAREQLRSYADRALARLRAQEFIKSLLVVLTVSLWTLALFIFADKYLSLAKIGIHVWIIWGGLSALGIPFILWRTYSPRIHENFAAIMADDRLGLNARLCTALTLDLQDPANAAFSEPFFAEALYRLQKLDVEKAFPVRVSSGYILLLLPLGAAFALHNFLAYQDKMGWVAGVEQKRKAEALQQQAGAKLQGKLEDLKKDVTDHSNENGGQYKTKQLIEQADNIAKELKEGKRNPDEAMMALGALKKEIQDEKERMQEGKDFLERIEKLQAKDLNLEESDLTKAVSEALKMGDAGQAARQLRKLAQDLRKDILDNPNKSDEQKQQELDKLKREVEKLAGALAEDEVLRDNLQELGQKLSPKEFEKLQEEIKKAEGKQAKANKNKQFGNDVEKQIEQVAEELERLEEDDDVALNENDEKEMEKLESVEEGIDQAMEGLNGEDENGEKKAGGEEAGGQPGGKSGKQGGDKGGQKKPGNRKGKSMTGRTAHKQGGQEGGEGGKQAGRQPGGEGEKGGPQGKPGDGLGEGQGVGHRPFHEIADPGFKAEKVKGDLQAGAITGLSHFRGQGAKGDAPVEFVRALEASEQDPRSALELERIPRDAKELVQDYFLNVKKGANIQPANAPTPDKGAAPTPAPDAGPKKEPLKE